MIVRGSFNHRFAPLFICRDGSCTLAYNSQHRPTTSHPPTAPILASVFVCWWTLGPLHGRRVHDRRKL